MDTQEIAQQLAEHCRNGTEATGLDTLYSDDAVSMEAPGTPMGGNPAEGRDAIKGKHEWWAANFDVHGVELEGPFLHGDMFSLTFEIDATDKNSGERWKSKEVALYHVDGGKIVKEQFFMAPMPG